jgi:hypothetical protein
VTNVSNANEKCNHLSARSVSFVISIGLSFPIVGLSRFDFVASGAKSHDHLRQFNVHPFGWVS